MRSALLVILVTMLASGCGDPEPTTEFELEIGWRSCSWETDADDGLAECATVQVPDRWGEPEGEVLELFVKRRRAAGTSRGQLWFLAGGPGVDGAFFETVWSSYAEVAAPYDVYIPDHRGTGRSSRLSCPVEEEPNSPAGIELTSGELPGCVAYLEAEWGERLEALRPSEAARDVAELIAALRTPGEAVFLYGRSYGTFLLHRYLQVAPQQASGVIFDSICGPAECVFPAPFDVAHAEVGELLLARCEVDAFCNGRLPNASQALAALLDDLDEGHCGQLGWGRDFVRRLLAMMVRDLVVRQYVPAAIRRLQRCNGSDVQALQRLTWAFFSAPDPPPATLTLRSMLLRNHVVFSEMWRVPTSAELSWLDGSSFNGGAVDGLSGLYAPWPHYRADSLAGKRAVSSVPALLLQGGLDPQTPPSAATSLRSALSGAAQYFVELPNAPHGILTASPTAGGGSCGATLMGEFLAAPRSMPAAGCASTAAPLDFAGDSATSSWLFGTADPWVG